MLRVLVDVRCLPCWFAFQCAALFRATVLAPLLGHPLRGLALRARGILRERPIPASFAPLGVYIYAVGGESCRNRLTLEGSARLRPETKPRLAPLVEFGVVLVVSASLPLPAPPLPSYSRRYAPQCFVGVIPPPRLATCLAAHPTNRVVACRSVRHSTPRPLPHLPLRRVFLRSFCARRRSVSELTLPTAAKAARFGLGICDIIRCRMKLREST